MHQDVVDLRAFYYRTKLGRGAKRVLQHKLRSLWPDTHGLNIASYGFGAPFMRPFLNDARSVICLMPGQQGVMPWPAGDANRSVLVEETDWPLAAGSIDRILVVHGLDTCGRPDALLDEVYRTLTPGGKALFVAASRAGLWARREVTPFGHARPYSFGQLEALLRRHRFLPERHAAALYTPPSERRFWLRTAPLWEGLGQRFEIQMMAGVVIVEASKQVYIKPKSGSAVSVKGTLEVLEGLAGPKPAAEAAPRMDSPRRTALAEKARN
ncbi:class I SAM-dependent methyltransferase [Halovulum sp. GXIMD14793]